MPQPEAPPSPVPTSQFASAFKGYDRIAVDDYVSKLRDELATTRKHHDEATTSVAELSRALSYHQKELTEAKGALARMADDPAGAAAMSERVKTMMKLAEEEIEELKQRAEADAANTRDAADAYSDKTRQKAEATAMQLAKEAEAQRLAADQEAAQLRAAMRRKAEDEVAVMRTETEKRVAEHKAQTERQVAEHKAQVERRVADLEASTKQRVAELESRTKARTDKMLADAERQLTEATAMRKQALELRSIVVDRLAASNSALQEALEKLGPAPE